MKQKEKWVLTWTGPGQYENFFFLYKWRNCVSLLGFSFTYNNNNNNLLHIYIYIALCTTTFQVVPGERFWPEYHGVRVTSNPEMKRIQKGRPKSTRIRTEMDYFDKIPNACGLCRVPGHKRNACPNAAGPSTQHQFF